MSSLGSLPTQSMGGVSSYGMQGVPGYFPTAGIKRNLALTFGLGATGHIITSHF